MTPWKHAESSVKKWGGIPQDYIDIHNWFDETKQYTGDWTHRALRHHSAGIEWAIKEFGHTITTSRKVPAGNFGDMTKITIDSGTCHREREVMFVTADSTAQEIVKDYAQMKGYSIVEDTSAYYEPVKVPTKLIAEQHVTEDCGYIPTPQDWLQVLTRHPDDWMLKVGKKITERIQVK